MSLHKRIPYWAMSPSYHGAKNQKSLSYMLPFTQISFITNFLLRLIVQDEKIGDVFVSCFSKSLVLEIYSDFINNFNQAMELAKSESKRKSAFADFLKVEDGNGFLGKNDLRILYQIERNRATIKLRTNLYVFLYMTIELTTK